LNAAARALAAACALLGAGCVSVTWRAEQRLSPPSAAVVEGFAPGTTTLGECLDRLGAPVAVWEYKGEGVALAYGSARARTLGFNASIPVTRGASASFDYDDVAANLRGYVLLFDAGWKLESVRAGYLREIGRALGRRRPAPTTDDPRAR